MKELLQRLIVKFGLETRPRLRKTIVGVIGLTIFLFGLALIVLPGPAIIVIPLGLAILASEFAWARRVLKRGKILVYKVRRSARPQKSEELLPRQ
jgi:uncharacterized membrane protein